MNKPPFNIIIGAVIVVLAAFQPMFTVTSNKVTLLDSGPSWGLIVWATLSVLAASYGGRLTTAAGLAVGIIINPILSKVLTDANIEAQFRLKDVTEFAAGSYGAWLGAVVIIVAALKQKAENEKQGIKEAPNQ